jgi:hypothetical protein
MIKHTPFEFTFECIPKFDARKGFRRCEPRGAAYVSPRNGFIGQTTVTADLWRAPDGNVVVRFTSQHAITHAKATFRETGQRIRDEDLGVFLDYIHDVLFCWVLDGVDDDPDPEPEPRLA